MEIREGRFVNRPSDLGLKGLAPLRPMSLVLKQAARFRRRQCERLRRCNRVAWNRKGTASRRRRPLEGYEVRLGADDAATGLDDGDDRCPWR